MLQKHGIVLYVREFSRHAQHGESPLTLVMMVGEENIQKLPKMWVSGIAWSSFHCLPFVRCFHL